MGIRFKLGAFLIFTLILSLRNLSAAGFADIPSDKGMHFGVSAASHMACSVVTEILTDSKWGSNIGCWMAVNTVGVLKEITDPLHKGTRDVTDVYANMAGSGFSFATLSIAF